MSAWLPGRRDDMPRRQPPVDEREVGIVEYVAPTVCGIGGIVKASYADFQVNELDTAMHEVTATADATASQDDSDGSDYEEDGGRSLTRFVLHKERMDTLGAVAELSQQLGLPPRAFGFCGLKDHRAITTQAMTVRGSSRAAVRGVQHPRLRVHSVRRASSALKLGMLGGNRFRITLRDARAEPSVVDAALRSLRRHGFINYYGLQRFGDCAARNDEVGRRLLLGEYAAAVDALLGPMGEREDSAHGASSAEAEARATWLHSGDARTAYKLMPRTRTLEREVLSSLAWHASNAPTSSLPHEEKCRLAMLALPLALRRLLAYAYFSRCFNIAASERLRRHGVGPAREGELVIMRKKLLRGRGGPRARREAVHVVTAEEASTGAYRATRVVLPLPGVGTRFPSTPDGSLYAQMLRLDGIDPHDVALERRALHTDATSPDDGTDPTADAYADAMDGDAAMACDAWDEEDSNWMRLQGDYRALLLRPRNMSWHMLQPTTPRSRCDSETHTEPGPDAPATDVALQFDLPPGAYATMALREVIKEHPPPSRQAHIRF